MNSKISTLRIEFYIQPDIEETVFLAESAEEYKHVCVGVAQWSQPEQKADEIVN